ncbi:hypothetical protein M5K25_023026 [Dendrobium thyrsiflorum]|uniref:Uncharacterized protein n=1 Tax=Dendrobium thyrsiflorum TaxID=117978 RepID=A0ABD0U766_DENTH
MEALSRQNRVFACIMAVVWPQKKDDVGMEILFYILIIEVMLIMATHLSDHQSWFPLLRISSVAFSNGLVWFEGIELEEMKVIRE